MSDLRLAIKIFAGIFCLCAILAVVVMGIDAWSHVGLADSLVRTFSEIMLACVSGIGGLFAGQGIERRRTRRRH